MTQTQERPATPSPAVAPRRSPQRVVLSPRRLNVLRVGYLVMGGGLAITKWPLLLDHEPWGLMEGTVQIMLVAMSVLALLGLRYPVQMLPILLFEVAWKLLWLGVVALPLWVEGRLDGAPLEQTSEVLWVVLVIAVVPWRFVLGRYATAPGDAWRRSR
jgi:hypothetical protein